MKRFLVTEEEKNKIKLLYESNINLNYVANELEKAMAGLGTKEDPIFNNIKLFVKTKKDWDDLQNAFGIRKGEGLIQWLQGDLSDDEYDELMSYISSLEGGSSNIPKKEDKNLKQNKECLIKSGFEKTTIGGPMVRRDVYEKTNLDTYQIAIDKNGKLSEKVAKHGPPGSQGYWICDWECDPSSTLGIKVFNCKKTTINYF